MKKILLGILIIAGLIAEDPENPFAWLEDSQDLKTVEWIALQNSRFEEYKATNFYNDQSLADLKRLSVSSDLSIPKKSGNHYFYTGSCSELLDVLYWQEGFEGKAEILFNPNQLKSKNVSIEDFIISPNGKLVAVGTSEGGSDWITYQVVELATGDILSDIVTHIKFSPIVWEGASKGFYYSRFEEDSHHSIYYHLLGTLQEADTLIYQNQTDGSVGYTPFITSDNRYLIIDAFSGSSGPNAICLIDLAAPNLKQRHLSCEKANYWFVGNSGDKLYFLTNFNAPYRKLVSFDVSQEELREQIVIKETDAYLERVLLVGNYFASVYVQNVVSSISIQNLNGEVQTKVPFHLKGRIDLNSIDQNSSEMKEELFFSFSNFLHPYSIYRYRLNTSEVEVFKGRANANTDDYLIDQIFYESKDKTIVPMFIAHKKGIKLDNNNRVLLSGYGAYGLNNYPIYNALKMAWLEKGGVVALANVRGGSEYGEDWHKAAMGENKQNSFDDFIAAAQWLIDKGYTKPSKLGVMGMSSGGLLVAASINQNPTLFGAAVIKVGLLDMLRFHLFTIGKFWINEHGNPDIPHNRVYLKKYSPCHNVQKEVNYPSILVAASENDDRVVPSHSYKYLAALQIAHPENKKMLLRLNSSAGHFSLKSSDWLIEEADILSFFLKELSTVF